MRLPHTGFALCVLAIAFVPGCTPSQPKARAAVADSSTECLDELRERLRDALVRAARHYRSEGPAATPGQLEKEAASKDHRHDLAVSVLLLPEFEQAIPFSRKLLTSDNRYVAFDAAVVLALLGDREGVPLLRSIDRYPESNSNHAFAYGKAALLLLGESIPAELRGKYSVFRDMEELIARCSPSDETPRRTR